VALVAGHEDPSKPESHIDWKALASFPGTLVIYMGVGRLAQIVKMLLENGKDPDTPAAVIEQATTARQRTVTAVLRGLDLCASTAGVKSPALIIIGPVVSLHSKLAWFERRPLFGKNVLVTRPRGQARALVRKLEQLGAIVHLAPAVEIAEPKDWTLADRAMLNLDQYQWLVFTSSNGVDALVSRLRYLKRDLRALGALKLAAIGPGTADTLRNYHLEPDLVPPEFRSESLATALRSLVSGQSVLLARADRGRDILREELAAVARVEQITIYSQTDGARPEPGVLELIRTGRMDYITFTSSNIARSFCRHLGDANRARIAAGQVRLVSISPVTSATIREMGLPVAAEATDFTTAGLLAALVAHAERG
jgi:uroporphyrinogen III methyltransferase/synthase